MEQLCPTKLFGGAKTNVDINQQLSVSESLLQQDINGQLHTVCVKEFLVPLRGRYKLKIVRLRTFLP